MNMFKPTTATTMKEYLAALPADRRDVIESIHALIQKTVPSLKPHFAYNMLGYGSFPYKNYKKEPIEWPVVALANQKNYISLYICAVDKGEYIAEKHVKDLGKVSVGKSCIRFKKIEDLNLDTLKKILKEAEKKPGLDGVGASKKSLTGLSQKQCRAENIQQERRPCHHRNGDVAEMHERSFHA